MNSLGFYLPAALLATALAVKFPAMLQDWHDPLLRSACWLLFVGGTVFFFAAPPTISTVNRITGVPNFSAPLTYCVLSAFSASCVLLIVNWRGGPPERTRRASHWCIGSYITVIVAIAVLFSLGDAPVERLRDLDTYYANTPFIREMIVVYLLAHSAAGVVVTVLCWRWQREVHGWLRAGLASIVTGYLLDLCYDVCKMAAVGARWAGHDWDYLSTYVAPPFAAAAAIFVAAGFILPLTGQRLSENLRERAAYRQLGPLWKELRRVAPHPASSIRLPWWAPVGLRLTQREADIHDGLLTLKPYVDRSVRTLAHDAATEAGADPEEAAAVAEAAVLTAAIAARTDDPDGERPPPSPPWDEPPPDLVRVSRALRHSPVVEAIRRTSPKPETGAHESIW
ncbi:MAB_1171c family putative transporter [Streptomyces monticola]|uniref:MAB_1171c family putative transporter n=1 Tax=Streptomyces monticola TaxID=2666263 RepID=A0ABW2JLS9_9ACTN